MSTGPVGERLARVEARQDAQDEEKIPERLRALESFKALLLGITAAASVMGSLVGYIWGEAIKKALGGP